MQKHFEGDEFVSHASSATAAEGGEATASPGEDRGVWLGLRTTLLRSPLRLSRALLSAIEEAAEGGELRWAALGGEKESPRVAAKMEDEEDRPGVAGILDSDELELEFEDIRRANRHRRTAARL